MRAVNGLMAGDTAMLDAAAAESMLCTRCLRLLTSLNPIVIWAPYWRGGVTNLVQKVTPDTSQMLFYRARRP